MNARRTELTIDGEPWEETSANGGALVLPERYRDLRQLGSGGFGEVRRVFDGALGRVVAMKFLRPDLDARPSVRSRFLAEIKLAAGLSHPGIVAIFDFGELSNGRLWFTMPEVEGRTLRAVIDEAFSAAPEERASKQRRLLDHFARVCDAVAYAHSRGVIHRDLKPENVMVGPFGQVFVMDWGLARKIGHEEDTEKPADAGTMDAGSTLTQWGDVLGTPAYMAPEQASGEVELHGPATDVHALGAMLHHLLVGEPPPRRRLGIEMAAAERGLGVPPELASICARSMAPDPQDRYPDAGALAAEIQGFLDGARRRERALTELEKSFSLEPAMRVSRERARAMQKEAKSLLSSVRPFDPVFAKLPGWTLEDEAEALLREAMLLETRWLEGVHGALVIDPELPEAHAALADHYKDRLIEAEQKQNGGEAARFEVLLRAHDRGRHVAILSGRGALSLVTDPPGASVRLYRWVLAQRRLVPTPVADLGNTPLARVSLDKGSYLLVVEAPGCETVRYPVLIERGLHWDGCPPGSREPYAIRLPRKGELAEDELYVPAGYAWTGGDPESPDSLPRRRVWLDGFVVGRHPVTNAEYLAFLNDLVLSGREAEALLACPRTNPGTRSGAGEALSFARREDGLFVLKTDDPGETWRPRGPAVLMDWRAAVAYTRWLSGRTNRPYRLLHELEREKATRGVDGRVFPWGNHLDPTFACMLSSHAGEPGRVDVDAYPLDEGPYGMRGGAGNSRDFCSNVWTLDGPAIEEGRVLFSIAAAEDPGYRSVRGGAWSSVENHCRAAARFVLRPDQRRSAIGLRVGRALP